MSNSQQEQTLHTIVSGIHISKCKSKEISEQSEDRQLPLQKKWHKHQNAMFFNLIGHYGSDFSLIQLHFPNKTRKQIKKKYHEIIVIRERRLKRVQQILQREQRKSIFEQQILEQATNNHEYTPK